MLGAASHAAGQSAAAPAFEVASVKPSNPDVTGPLGVLPLGRIAPRVGGRFSASNITLRELVIMAYNHFDSPLEGGPDWQTSRRFDIQAKAKDPAADMDAMVPMLKTLLADRFQLKVHTEMREMPVFALVIARDGQFGANITPSTADCSDTAEQQRVETRAKAGPGAVAELLQAGQGLPCAVMPVPARVAGSMTWRGNGVSMAGLAAFLTTITRRTDDRMVLDRTGLSGLYDWELTFDRAVIPRARDAQQTGTSVTLSDSPSLRTAVQEQLGLKLESARGPVEFLVIDSAALPAAN
jgi:uncharacterized protein (TIGR03435 family)